MKKSATSAFIAAFLMAIFLSSTVVNSQLLVASAAAPSQPANSSRLGFWVDERDMWSGVGLAWTPQQFVTNYFESPPYPSAMLFATAMIPTGANSPGAIGEAQWLGQVAGLAQSDGLNVKILILFFVNLSGGTVNGISDQATLLTQYMAALGSHSNIYGAEYEREYYGNTLAEVTTFKNIVNGAGYVNVDDPTQSSNFPSDPVLDYSTYPYFGGNIPSASPSGSRSIGVGYGETGAPSGSTPNPAWTQSTVQAIVDISPANPFVIIYAGSGGTGQPAWQMWNWPTLQQWIWTDQNYQANFILATSSSSTTTSTSTTSTTSHSTTTSTSVTKSSSTSASSSTTSSSTTTSTSTTSTSSDPTTTSTSVTTSSSTTTTSSTSVAATTSSTTTTIPTTSTSSSASTSTSESSTATAAQSSSTSTVDLPPQVFSLSVVGGCPSTGGGTYNAGAIATVEFTGVCDRNGASGLRVTSWSLDDANNFTVNTNGTLSIFIAMNSPHTLRLYTVTQYSLTLDFGAKASLLSITSPTITQDGYWYDSGTLVTFTGLVGLNGSNVTGWALDGAAPTPISVPPDFTTSISMGSPHTLIVILSTSTTCSSQDCSSTTPYHVTVQSLAGDWVDGAYYPISATFAWQAGSVHNITAMQGVRQSSLRASFSGWSGMSNSKSRTVMLSVNESGYLTAGYSKFYLVSLSFTDAGGATVLPQSVTVIGPSGSQNVGANMTVWEQSGLSYSIGSAIWMGWNVAVKNESSFTVNQPEDITFPLAVYPQTIKVTDAYNLPLQGATANVTTLNGVSLTSLTDSNGIARFEVPLGLFSATVNYLGVNSQVVSSTGGSHSFTVTFLLSYPLIATIGGVSAASAIFVLLRLRLRKKVQGGPRFFSD